MMIIRFIRNEIAQLLTAVMFFTRIPCGTWFGYSDEMFHTSRKYFPAVGWIVGFFGAVILYLFLQILPPNVAVILSMGATILLTGAFHEDGLGDICDSFGGGYTVERILTIMKDSRMGAYGVIGMVMMLLLKFSLLISLATIDSLFVFVALINSHTISRFMASLIVESHVYVQDIDKSKSKPMANRKLTKGQLLYSFVLAILPIILFQDIKYALLIPIGWLTQYFLGLYFKKIIGGYTGDCLGTTQQVCEVTLYISIYLLWKYM